LLCEQNDLGMDCPAGVSSAKLNCKYISKKSFSSGKNQPLWW